MTRGKFNPAVAADDHIPEESLELYSMNRLPETETEQLEIHLLTCEHCQDRLRQVDDYVRAVRLALREMPKEWANAPAPAGVSRFASWFRLRPAYTWSAVLAFCVVVLVLPRFQPQRLAPQEIYLQSLRGAEATVASPGRSLVLLIDTTGLPASSSYIVQVAGARGRVFVQKQVAGTPGSPVLRLALTEPLGTGKYWVRVCDRQYPDRVLRETALAVR